MIGRVCLATHTLGVSAQRRSADRGFHHESEAAVGTCCQRCPLRRQCWRAGMYYFTEQPHHQGRWAPAWAEWHARAALRAWRPALMRTAKAILTTHVMVQPLISLCCPMPPPSQPATRPPSTDGIGCHRRSDSTREHCGPGGRQPQAPQSPWHRRLP